MNTISKQSRRNSRKWGGFANFQGDAHYNFLNQIVCLDSIESTHKQAYLNGATPARNKIVPLLAHEYTHFIDHISTLWGRNNLYKYMDAYYSRINESEHKYGPKIVLAYSQSMKIKDQDYYTFKGNYEGSNMWGSEYTSGLRFDRYGVPNEDDPIFFIRFSDPHQPGIRTDQTLAVRVPISPVTITEATAQYSEYLSIVAEQSKYQDKTPAKASDWADRFRTNICKRDNAFYISLIHMVANNIGTPNHIDALKYSSAFAYFILNMPDNCYENINIIHSEYEAQRRVQAGLINRDVGALAYSLLYKKYNRGSSPEEWIDNIAMNIGLKSLYNIETSYNKELSLQHERLSELNPRLETISNLGLQWAKHRGLISNNNVLIDVINKNRNIPLPDCILGDDTTMAVSNDRINIYNDLEIEEWFFEHAENESKMNEFYSVCH